MRNDPRDEACISLWHAVINQAIEDAKSIEELEGWLDTYRARHAAASNGSEEARAALKSIQRVQFTLHQARHSLDWLTKPNADFAYVCELLGLEPIAARRLILMALQDNPTNSVVYNPAKKERDK